MPVPRTATTSIEDVSIEEAGAHTAFLDPVLDDDLDHSLDAGGDVEVGHLWPCTMTSCDTEVHVEVDDGLNVHGHEGSGQRLPAMRAQHRRRVNANPGRWAARTPRAPLTIDLPGIVTDLGRPAIALRAQTLDSCCAPERSKSISEWTDASRTCGLHC
jgi:hypothetical protein